MRSGSRLRVEELEPRVLLAHAPVTPLDTEHTAVPFHVGAPQHAASRRAAPAQLLQVPGQPGQVVAVRFTTTFRDAVFNNELGIFSVDDAQGRIGKLHPGEPGYAAAALSRGRYRRLVAAGQGAGGEHTLQLPAGGFVGFYLVSNATREEFLAQNRTNRLGDVPNVMFSLVRANPDHFDHMRRLPGRRFAFEDALFGGDRDFNDLVLHVHFGTPQGGGTSSPPPALTARLADDTAPGGTTNADGVTSDPAVAGTVTASAAVTSLRAGFDGTASAAFVDVTAALQRPFACASGLCGGGAFALDRVRLAQVNGGSLPDGRHTLHLRATDANGNTAAFDLPFTLDTQAPAATFQSPRAGEVTNGNATVSGKATDSLSGVASLQAQIDGGTPFAVTATADGSFGFPTALPLDGSADGAHTVRLQATDRAGNVSGPFDVSFTLDTGLVLREGTAFHTSHEQDLTIPADPSVLTFTYRNLAFDTPAPLAIKDAFEASLVDANGQPLVHTIGAGRDAFLNLTSGQAPDLGADTSMNGTAVTVNLAGIPPGTSARLIYRLVNNDGATTTEVHVTQAQILPNPGGQPAAATPAAAALTAAGPVDLSTLSDVSSAFTPEYGQTAFDEADHVLYTDLALRNTGQYAVATPLVLAVAHLSDPSVRVRGSDGLTPDGLPYYNLSGLVTGRTLNPGDATTARRLAFVNPNRTPFTYDLVVLGQLNRPPAFTSQPNTEAIPGVPYSYQATAADPDEGETLTFSLLMGPAGMAVDAATGKVTWSPQQSDLGTHTVALRVDDGRGASAEQDYVVSATPAPANRPPVFTSEPVVDARVGSPYRYPATASDPDGDPLTFSVLSRPSGLTIDPATGLVTWTPTADQVGDSNQVSLQVSDGRLAATQTYVVCVDQAVNDHAPHFVSTPPAVLNFPELTTAGAQVVRIELTPTNVGSGRSDIFTTLPTQDPALFGLTGPDIRKVNFDTTPSGVPIPSGAVLSNEYASLGVLMNNIRVSGSVYGGPASPPNATTTPFVPGIVYAFNFTVPVVAAGVINTSPDQNIIEFFNPDGVLISSTRDQDDKPGPNFDVDRFVGLRVTGDNRIGSMRLINTTGQLELDELIFEVVPTPAGVPRYGYAARAVDADSDPLTYALSAGPTGMAVDPGTGKVMWAGPTIDRVLKFDGVNDFALVPDSPSLSLTQHATLTSWVRFDQLPSAAGHSMTLLAKSQNGNDLDLQAETDNRLHFYVANGAQVTSNTVLQAGVWYHVAATYAASGSLQIYINGGLDVTQAIPGVSRTNGTNPFTLGASAVQAGRFLKGSLDDVRVYDAVRTGPQILAEFQRGQPADTTGLVAAWGFNELASDGITDESGFNNHGILGGDGVGSDLPARVLTDVPGASTGFGSYPVTLRVADDRGGFDTQSFAVNVTQDQPDEIHGTAFNDLDGDGSRGAGEDPLSGWTIYLAQNHNGHRDDDEPFTTTDSNGTYSFTNLPPGNYLVAEEGQPGWRPTSPADGSVAVTLTAGQLASGIDFGSTQSNVPPGNRAPVFASTAVTTATVGQLLRYDTVATDLDGDPLTFDLPVKPAGMAIDPLTGVVVWTPSLDQVGPQPVLLRVQDGHGGIDLQSFTVTVGQPNSAPVITSTPPAPAVKDVPYQYQVRAQDGEGDTIHYRLDTPPAGMAIDATAGLVTWTPAAGQVGSQHVVLVADDGKGGQTTQAFDLTVVDAAANATPVITSTPRSQIQLGGTYLYAVRTADADGDPLTYHLDTAPAGMTIDTAALISWQPAAAQFGPNAVTVRVDDGRGGSATQTFTVNVVTQDTNRPPVITSTAPLSATVGELYEYDVTAGDSDGDPLGFVLEQGPAGMSISSDLGTIRWVPRDDQAKSNDVVVRVTDGHGGQAEQRFTVTLHCVNSPPVIVSTPPTTATPGATYTYPVQAFDPDNDPLRFSLTTAPAGMSIDLRSGLITWNISAGGGNATPGPAPTNGLALTPAAQAAGFTLTNFAAGFPTDPNRPTVGPIGMDFPDDGGVLVSDILGNVRRFPTDNDGQDANSVAPGQNYGLSGLGLAHVGSNIYMTRGNANDLVQINPDGTLRQEIVTNLDVPQGLVANPANGHLLVGTPGNNTILDVDPIQKTFTVLVRNVPAPDGLSVSLDGSTVYAAARGAGGGGHILGFRTSDGTEVFDSGDIGGLAPSLDGTAVGAGSLSGFIFANTNDGRVLQVSLATNASGSHDMVVIADGGTRGDFVAVDPHNGTLLLTQSDNIVRLTPPAGASFAQAQVTVRVDDGHGGSDTQDYTILIGSKPPDRPPIITSVPSRLATVSTPYQYAATAIDPEGEAVHFALAAAPDGMTIDPASGVVQWTPALSQVGGNDITVTATDTAGNVATQNFVITVAGTNRAPLITSVPVTAATAGLPYRYDLQATDPDGDPLSYRIDTGPQGMAIDASGRVAWSPGVADVGTQHVTINVSDNRGLSATQSYDITVAADTEAPRVQLLVSANPIDLGATEMFLVLATDNVGVQTLGLTVGGVHVALDANGRASVPMTTAGQVAVVATATDAAGNAGQATGTVTVIDRNVTNAPTVAITAPDDDAVITAPTDVIGTASDPNLVSYTLAVAPFAGGPFTEFAHGTSSVTDGVLGKFDPSMLQNDSYVIRLTAQNTGGLISTVDRVVNVAGDLKLGNFRLSFTDLTLPVSGIPITVGRTYDTLTANNSGDFGFGWRLEFRDVDLRTSVPKTGDEADGIYNPFRDKAHVYITLPGGQREGFTFQPRVDGIFINPFYPLYFYHPEFVADPGVTDKLAVPDFQMSKQGNQYFSFGGDLPYNPADSSFGGTYTLTTKDGTVYQIDATQGKLLSVTDPNGNQLTFTDAGISSSTGKQVTFDRDAQGRIVSVTDPMGKQIRYQYDANGDLVRVTDRAGAATQLQYLSTPAHYLQQVIDPLGRTGVRTEYDAQGRLVKTIDGSGHAVQVAYDPTHSTETVTDPLGNATTFEYDDRGNIVTQVDALGGVTLRTYDANNDTLTQTDPLGHTTAFTYDDNANQLTQTDPLGNVTRHTYQTITLGVTGLTRLAGGAPTMTVPTSTIDPLGNTSASTYDAAGNLTSLTNPDGGVTRVTYDGTGNFTSLVDAGGTATFVYDDAGNVISETDPLGNEKHYTYDANGNKLSQTLFRTVGATLQPLTTTFQYDAENRLTVTTDPLGGVSRIEYNALGQVSARVDALGRRTTYEYDAAGRLTRTTYPDGLSESIAYDAAGNKIEQTDRAGRKTTFQYDALNRLVATLYPDNTHVSTVYDAAGGVTATIDANGNRTDYTYDAGGRLLRTQLPGVTDPSTGTVVRPQVLQEYDANGNETAQVDADGHRTEFAYDSFGRQTVTHFADGTTTERHYDTLGQLVAQVDQAGGVTAYSYDAVGHLLSVTLPPPAAGVAPPVTSYAYDEVGNRLSQTDALGHTTQFQYDALGRLVGLVRPGGQAETMAYDAVGNLVSQTDFNGHTIAFTYDSLNRLTKKLYPDGSAITFTYTPTGQRATVTDAQGTTAYTYDARDRLLSRIDPDGRSIAYAYDAAGNETSVTTASGTTANTYDALNRLLTVTAPEGGVTHYAYDPTGNLVRTDSPDSTTETRTYDALNRLLSEQTTGPGGVLAGFQYTLSATGLRTSVTEASGRRVDYAYDADYRLTREAITDATAGNRTIAYTYDAVGNRLSRNDSTEGVTTYQYDEDDRLLVESRAGDETHYTYDANGNTLSQVHNATDQVFATFDFDNRLIAADVTDAAGTRHIGYRYDADGNRVAQSTGGQEMRYLVDANRPFAEVLEEYQPGGATAVSYVYGLGLISQDRGGQQSFYVADGLGSTRALADSHGLVTDQYAYDAYGRIIGQSGSTANNYLFAGEQLDPNMGLYYLRARYYAPSIGRFLTTDPFAGRTIDPGSLHRYLYAGANPVNFKDPSGLAQTSAEAVTTVTLVDILASIASNALTAITELFVPRTFVTLVVQQIERHIVTEVTIEGAAVAAVRSGIVQSVKTIVGNFLPGVLGAGGRRGMVEFIKLLIQRLPQAAQPYKKEIATGILEAVEAFLNVGLRRTPLTASQVALLTEIEMLLGL
jgi:RHS repeat-associated protein